MSNPARGDGDDDDRFRLLSTQFKNNGTLPIITIFNNPVNGVNTCSVDGSAGGDQSPELHWKNAPRGTRTFVLIDFDVTASFMHWGMYNIPSTTHELPPNAGVAGSAFGTEVYNDFFVAQQYDGPCPPDLAPFVHHYVFTLYALDIELEPLGNPPNFLPFSETILGALLTAGREGHILGSASITGLYSGAPSN